MPLEKSFNTPARSFQWFADVQEQDGRLFWKFDIPNLNEVRLWLPFRRSPGQSLEDAWQQAILQEDFPRAEAKSVEALRAGDTGYHQHFGLQLESGEVRQLFENVQVDADGPSHWHLTGTCVDVTEYTHAEDELRDIMARAHCLIWYAEIVDDGHHLRSAFHFPEPAATLRWLPIVHQPDDDFCYSWSQAIFPEDLVQMGRLADLSRARKQPYYSQEFRVRLANGQIRRIAENVQLEIIAPGHWFLIGVCVDVTERSRAQEELQEAMGSAHCLIWRATVQYPAYEWEFRITNEAAAMQWLPIARGIGQSMAEAWVGALDAEDYARCHKNWQRAFETGLPSVIQEFRVRLADGEVRWLTEDARIEPDGPNQFRLVGVCTDITARKLAERDLYHTLDSARCIVWHASVSDTPYDQIWSLRISNEDACRRLWPVTQNPNQTVAAAWADARLPEDAERADLHASQALQANQTQYSQEFRLRLENGEVRWLAEDVQIELLEPGRWHLVGVCTDVTERKQTETHLQEVMSGARCVAWRADVRSIANAVLWNFHFLNPEAVLRWLPIAINPGQPFQEAWEAARLPDEHRQNDQTCGEALQQGLKGYTQEYRVRLADGQLRWMLENVQIEVQGHGHWRLVGLCTDITLQKQRDEELRRLITSARCLVWHAEVELRDTGLHWEIRFTDEEAARRWLPISIAQGQNFSEALNDAQMPEILKQMDDFSTHAILSGESFYRQEYPICLADGQIRWLNEDAQIEVVAPGQWRLVGVCTDMTERKQAEEELRNLIASARCLVWQASVQRDSADPELLHWQINVTDEIAAQHLLPIAVPDGHSYYSAMYSTIPAEYRAQMDRVSWDALRQELSGYSQEFPCLLENGEECWLAEDVRIERHGDNAWRLVGVCTDITARKANEIERERRLAEAIELADRDPLTGLFNHRAFQLQFAEEARRAISQELPLGVVVLDLDNFKFLNDLYGHRSGDAALQRIAESLRSCCRSRDTLARFGGDEFAVLMPGLRAEEVAAAVVNLNACLDTLHYLPPNSKVAIPLTLSIGYAVFPDESSNRLDVLSLADVRLRRAKVGEDNDDDLAERLRAYLLHSIEGFSMLNALVVSVDTKDRYTRRHSEDVLVYSLEIAQELGLDEETQHLLQIAALLHDVGKIGVPDHILRKPGTLHEEEVNAIKQHAMMGAAIVSAVPGFEGTLDAIRHHHERWDGGGYPFGLLALEIPLLARIMAVADAYSAMTTDRPYRKGMTPMQAWAILQAGAGTQWDLACVEAFRRRRFSDFGDSTTAV